MDSGPGRCWVCDAPGKIWCSGCRFALYCSLACQKKDKARHLDECMNSSRRRVHCSYCGRDETLGGVPCPDCLVSSYCTDSCRKIDAKSHKPICQKSREKVLEAAKKIGDWNRRAKGIPQYLGRLIHAVDYLRWNDNEGSKTQTPTAEASKHKKADEWQQRESRRGHRSTADEMMEMEEETLRLLLLGADLKHVLRTLHETPDSCTQGIDITLLDSSPHIIARDLLVLYLLMLPDAPTPLQDQAMLKAHAEKVVMVFYSLGLDMETHALLCNTLHNLLNMTYKSFLHEMRQQVYIDAVSYTLVQAVWSGWMSFANDPSAMQKLEKVRTLKMSGKVVKDVLSRYVKSCPKEHQRVISDWIKRGSIKKQKGGYFPNVTLACFSPLKKEYLDKFEDVNPKWSEETEWIKAVSPEDDMIYAPHGIDMIFQDWDFALVSKKMKKEGNVVEMYLRFLTQVFRNSSKKLLRSNQITISFIRTNIKDLKKKPSPLRGKFDRIATGIHADLLGTPFVLQELGSLLRTDNSYARLLTHHRVWSLCLNWQQDQQAREMCHKCVKSNRPPDPVMMLSARWATFRHFLQAELLHHLHILDGRPIEIENVLTFRDISHAYDMLLSDYSHHLNKIVPFRFRPEKRVVSMVDSRLHTLEWRRVGRSRRISAPAATHPKALPYTQSPEVDPASRYVDNLITLSRNSPAPSPTSSDSRPSSSTRCSRESSLSPCPPDHQTGRDERNSRSRTTNRPRPRSLYVSTRCKSPLLSTEFDFWEQQNLIKEMKNTSKFVQCTEIPEGIKHRAQKSLEAELTQAKNRAKSAPASPQSKCKARLVKEKANAFERGTAARSTVPETRKHIDAITPSTPVKKLVMMFSKAFAAKEKDTELQKPMKRSSSFHGRRASFEQEDPKGTLPKEYTNSLKINRSNREKTVVESGTSTFPRKSRPHSIAVSKFAYLEGCIDKRVEAFTSNSEKKKEVKKSEAEKKREVKKPTSLNLTDSIQMIKGHTSPIRSLIAGLNTLSVSPVMPRAAKHQKKTSLKNTISIKRDELRLVNLRPGSPILNSPMSGSPTFENIKAIDWPVSNETISSIEKSSPRKIPTDSQLKTPTDSPSRTPTNSPQIKKSPSSRKPPSPSTPSSIPKMLSQLKRSLKKIPHEPEYIAPPLFISKSPSILLHSPSSEAFDGHLYQQVPPVTHDDTKMTKLEDIFSPKPSPSESQVDLYHPPSTEHNSLKKAKNNSGLRVQTIQPDIERRNMTPERDVADESSIDKKDLELQKEYHLCRENVEVQKLNKVTSKSEEILSTEDTVAIASASMSASLTEADLEVSKLFSHEETFSPIKPKRRFKRKEDNYIIKDDESESSQNEYTINKEKKHSLYSTQTMGDEAVSFAKALLEKQHTNSPVSITDSPNPETLQSQIDIQSSSKSPSPHLVEQCPPVYKMVERFAQRIQAEQQLIERPVSPKSYNVMKRNSWCKSGNDQCITGKEAVIKSEAKSIPKTEQTVSDPEIKEKSAAKETPTLSLDNEHTCNFRRNKSTDLATGKKIIQEDKDICLVDSGHTSNHKRSKSADMILAKKKMQQDENISSADPNHTSGVLRNNSSDLITRKKEKQDDAISYVDIDHTSTLSRNKSTDTVTGKKRMGEDEESSLADTDHTSIRTRNKSSDVIAERNKTPKDEDTDNTNSSRSDYLITEKKKMQGDKDILSMDTDHTSSLRRNKKTDLNDGKKTAQEDKNNSSPLSLKISNSADMEKHIKEVAGKGPEELSDTTVFRVSSPRQSVSPRSTPVKDLSSPDIDETQIQEKDILHPETTALPHVRIIINTQDAEKKTKEETDKKFEDLSDNTVFQTTSPRQFGSLKSMPLRELSASPLARRKVLDDKDMCPDRTILPQFRMSINTQDIEKIKEGTNKKFEDIPCTLVLRTSSPRQSVSLRSTPVNVRKKFQDEKNNSSSEIATLPSFRMNISKQDKECFLKEVSNKKSENLSKSTEFRSSSPKQSVSLRSTPVKELSSTPVTKMVEKFALQIQAQSLPPSPRSSRPQSIGTLIQQDFLRLYTENPPVDESKPEEDLPENSSLVSDCCEETMFDISEDEEQKTGDISLDADKRIKQKHTTTEVNHKPLQNAEDTEKNTVDEISPSPIDSNAPSPIESNEKKVLSEVHVKMREKFSTSKTASPTPRDSRCDELRHEFLQKVRGISPIPPSKKKYGEIKATLSKRKYEMMQGEKIFADEINNDRAYTSSPRLEDMAIVNYSIKVDADSLTERLRTPPITPRDDPGGAICLLADKESDGLDGDSLELCSGEYKLDDDKLTKIGRRNSSPIRYIPRYNTLPRKTKSRKESPSSSLNRIARKKKVAESDIAQHKVQMLKSSRTGGMDKMTFRHFVKTSIASEDLHPENYIVDNDTVVIEYSSSIDVSNEELDSNAEYVEEAIEAISFTSEEDEPPQVIKKTLPLQSENSQYSENSDYRFRQSSSKKQHNVNVRRKRLPSARSPSDLKENKHQASSLRAESKKYDDDSDNDNTNIKNTKKLKGSKKTNVQVIVQRECEQSRLSPLGMSFSDDARQSPDSVDFKVEIPDTPIDNSRDIRRFMWGSLKKKHVSTRSKRDHKPIEDQPSGSDDASARLTPDNLKGPALKLFFDKKDMSEEELCNEQLDSSATETKSSKRVEETTSKRNTAPTIVAMVPKHRGSGSPIVGLRLSRESTRPQTKSPPPKTPPKPKKKDTIDRATSFSTEDMPQSVISLNSNEWEYSNKNTKAAERPRSWAGIESLDNMETQMAQASIPEALFPRSVQDADGMGDKPLWVEENEVFIETVPLNSDEMSQHTSDEKVEMRPRAGVLKNGDRDRSRESRRSLRVSWGDLPERENSPSPPTDCNEDDQDDEPRQEADEHQQDKAEGENNEAFRVTQL